MGNTLSSGKHDTQAHPVLDWDADADGNVEYQYASYYVEWQTVGRLVLDPKPICPDARASFASWAAACSTSTVLASCRCGRTISTSCPATTFTSRAPSVSAPTP